MTRMREDDRFRAVTPESVVLATSKKGNDLSEGRVKGEIWFDWAFVDFWRSGYCEHTRFNICYRFLMTLKDTIQKGFSLPPDQSFTAATSTGGTPNPETTMLLSSLRDVIQSQAGEIESLKAQLQQLQQSSVRCSFGRDLLSEPNVSERSKSEPESIRGSPERD